MFPSSIVLLTLSLAVVVRSDLTHYVTFKSFYTALFECGEYFEVDNTTLDQYVYYGYPSTPEVKRLIHCTLVNLGAWNDKTGVRKNVIQFLFKPNERDNDYEDRTQHCLDQICPLGYDQNYLAYEAFSCYYRQYGRLVKDEVYVPLEDVQFFQLLMFIGRILAVSPDTIKRFAQGEFINDPVFKQALYIGAIRQGSYNLKTGFQLDIAYAQYNIPEFYTPCTAKCVADVSAEYSHADAEELVYVIYKQCFHKYVEPLLEQYFQAYLDEKVCALQALY